MVEFTYKSLLVSIEEVFNIGSLLFNITEYS